MKREIREIGVLNGLLFCVSIFLILFIRAIDVKAADPSVGYPSRPIEYVTHASIGGSMHVFGQIISDIIQKEKILSQPMIIVNKTGSGGAIACAYTYERKGNPHIFMAVASGSFLTLPLLETVPYTFKSFPPIANMAVEGSILAVRKDSPFKTIYDLIAEAKKRPNTLTQGGSSFAGDDSLTGQSIQKMMGVKWNFISFKNGGEAVLNVLGGNIDFTITGAQYALDFVRAGKMRALLAGAPNRYPEYKDVPTIKEAGMGEPILTYRGFVGTPNMPEYAMKKIEATLKQVMENDRFKQYLKDKMYQPLWLSFGEYGKFLEEESNRWKVGLGELNLLKNK
jgi:putative tricarboxylic transport membrane protein